MLKESIICIAILTSIFIGNYCTQNYTKTSVTELSNMLDNLEEVVEENINHETEKEEQENIVKNKSQELYNNWKQRYAKLAYFIEHDELEKVETNITSLKSFIETDEYSESISELDKCDFILKHIEEKYKFNLQNIF